MTEQLPEHFQPLEQGERFRFHCHPGVSCFTECCRQLDLALTPYDVLRLKKRLGLRSDAFLDQYVIIEWDQRMVFPVCYLTMVDDGRASCVFVKPNTGCTVYEDRPGACRAYPVGRGSRRRGDGGIEEIHVLVREPHCLGFGEDSDQTASEYFQDQGLADYNRANDLLIPLLHHEKIRQGFRPGRGQLDQYIMALYNLDLFRQEMSDGRIRMNRPLRTEELGAMAGDDEELLRLAIRWLRQEFFGELT